MQYLLRGTIIALLAAAPLHAQTPCVEGLARVEGIGDFECSNVDLVGHVPVSAFATDGSPDPLRTNDVWGWTDPETGVEYALVGTRNGVGFVDLSDPTAPRLVGKLPSAVQPTANSTHRDVKVYRDVAYVVAELPLGMQVFDLTRLRGQTGPPVTFTEDVLYDRIGNAHNIAIDEASGFAYAVGAVYFAGEREALGLPAACDVPGFHAIDIRDPLNPTFATCFSDADRDPEPYSSAGYTHDAQCLTYAGPDADYTGRQLCMGSNEDVVAIFDVTDKAAVRLVAQAAYPNATYTHQGWFSEDQRYFFVNDEIDEQADRNNGGDATQRTIVLDLLDLDEPEVAFIHDSGVRTVDHNQYARGGLLYQSNYEAGLRILDLSRVGDGVLTEVAYFDTHILDDDLRYAGNWSNYPFLESGLVLATDMRNGLFVLRVTRDVETAADRRPEAAGVALSEPMPNPATGDTRLSLRVRESQRVRAALYDVGGRRLADVFDGAVGVGAEVRLQVPVQDLPAGVYVIRVTGETFEAARRLVVAR
jgi:choice-of-anchor B domain-containing protein